MDAAAAAAAAAADPPEEEQSSYDRALEKVASNTCKEFGLRELDVRMTIPQAKVLYDALMQSTSIEKFFADLEFCPLPTAGLFADYIRSNPKLKSVAADYAAVPSDSDETRQCYKAEIDNIFQSVSENPSITKLEAMSFGNPNSIYNLLANSKWLEDLYATGQAASSEVAISIATGISRNSSIKKLELDMESGPELDIVLSGLGTSSVESLFLWPGAMDVNFFVHISKVLFFVPSLKELAIDNSHCSYKEGGLGNIFVDLRNPSCIRLTKLLLSGVLLASGTDTGPSNAVSIEQANTTVHDLELHLVRFDAPRTVCLLWNLVGVRTLFLRSPTYMSSNSSDESQYEYWAGFIRRNRDLGKVRVVCGSDHGFLNGVLDGAREHKSLTHVTIAKQANVGNSISGDVGLRLCRVLQEPASSLIGLYFENARLEQEFITLLVAGLCQNQSLEELVFNECSIETNAVIEILESILVNQTLQTLVFHKIELSGPNGASFGRTLLEVFKENKSLLKLTVSKVDLRAGALAECLSGLQENKTLQKFIFDECRFDNEGMACLAQTLQLTNLGLDEIGLPVYTDGAVDEMQQGRLAFLRGLVHMPTIRKVHFGRSLSDMDDESLEILLRAVKENKKIHVFDEFDGNDSPPADADSRENSSFAVREIEYNLKLNRYGRRILDTPNVMTSLWPRILSPMAKSKTEEGGDSDALFFFLREYFSRQSQQCNGDDSLNEQQQEPPPQKKARMA